MKFEEEEEIILPQFVEFWENKQFVFENFYQVDPETGYGEIGIARTRFNHAHYLKILIEMERVKLSSPLNV
jgi:hypothetical protein